MKKFSSISLFFIILLGTLVFFSRNSPRAIGGTVMDSSSHQPVPHAAVRVSSSTRHDNVWSVYSDHFFTNSQTDNDGYFKAELEGKTLDWYAITKQEYAPLVSSYKSKKYFLRKYQNPNTSLLLAGNPMGLLAGSKVNLSSNIKKYTCGGVPCPRSGDGEFWNGKVVLDDNPEISVEQFHNDKFITENANLKIAPVLQGLGDIMLFKSDVNKRELGGPHSLYGFDASRSLFENMESVPNDVTWVKSIPLTIGQYIVLVKFSDRYAKCLIESSNETYREGDLVHVWSCVFSKPGEKTLSSPSDVFMWERGSIDFKY